MKYTLPLIAAFAVSGCMSTYEAGGQPQNTPSNATSGAVLGAAIGGIIGASSDDKKLSRGILGAAIGGTVGGLIGQRLDQQAQDLQGELGSDVTIENTGSELVVTMPQDILFETNSSTVSYGLQGDLQALARNLLNYPDTSVEVVGHTDNVGDASYNQDLSSRRANEVASILISNGVPSGRIFAYGQGEDKPVATNLTEEGKAQNRRVEIIITPNV